MDRRQGIKLVFILALSLTIAALVVLLGVDDHQPARAAKLDTPPFGPGVSVWSDATLDSGEPVVAYNSVRDEYLVVWEDYNATEIAIHGQRVRSDGQLQGGRITIAAYSTYTSTQPTVAYSPVVDQYLVVYTSDCKPSYPPYHDYDLGGRFIHGDGTVGDYILLDAWTNEQTWHPAVAYNPHDDEFMVVWEIEHGSYRSPGLRHDIWATRVYSDTLSGGWNKTNRRCVVTGGPTGANDDRERVWPALAYNAARNEFLIVYTREAPPDDDVLGKVAAANLDGIFATSEITLSTQAYDQSRAAVAAGPDEYLVVWQNEQSSGRLDVFGRRVRGSDGLPLGSAGGFVINQFLNQDSRVPQLGYGPAFNYMVTWETYGPTWLEDVYANTIRVGEEMPSGEPFFIDGGIGCSQREPDVACAPDGDCFFVDADDVSGDYDIDGVFLVPYRVYLPLALRDFQ